MIQDNDIIRREPTRVHKGIPCIEDYCLCTPATLLEFWQMVGGVPRAPPPSSCTMCEAMNCNPSAPVMEIDVARFEEMLNIKKLGDLLTGQSLNDTKNFLTGSRIPGR